MIEIDIWNSRSSASFTDEFHASVEVLRTPSPLAYRTESIAEPPNSTGDQYLGSRLDC